MPENYSFISHVTKSGNKASPPSIKELMLAQDRGTCNHFMLRFGSHVNIIRLINSAKTNIPALHCISSSAHPQSPHDTLLLRLSYSCLNTFVQCWKLHARHFAASPLHSCRPQREDFVPRLRAPLHFQPPVSCSEGEVACTQWPVSQQIDWLSMNLKTKMHLQI